MRARWLIVGAGLAVGAAAAVIVAGWLQAPRQLGDDLALGDEASLAVGGEET